jgi:hypothetical protein
LPKEDRQAYERYEDDLHYQASMVESTYTIGVMKGVKQGIEQGMIKGENKKAIRIAGILKKKHI